MRTRILICFIFINAALFCQNWNVFNKAYRYNYKYNFSQLVSNVLFVDSVKFSGTDTIYAMNRIGVECTGSCPTVTAPLSPTVNYLVPNMPQFLQRRIYKHPDGRVSLFDTTKIVIVPTCTLNQNWLFDSIYSKTAVCVNNSTVNVFGVTDSLKTIMIDGVDSLELSKSFGILKFPDLYNKNKYFRLAGIERKNIYGIVALYGEKVPNGWDFYNFQVGDEYCYYYAYSSVPYQPSGCYKFHNKILNKSYTDSSVKYSVAQTIFSYTFFTQSSCPPPQIFSISTATNIIQYFIAKNLFDDSNRLYPFQVYPGSNNDPVNLVKFGLDDAGRFYKFCGKPCMPAYSSPLLPNLNEQKSYSKTMGGNYIPDNYFYNSPQNYYIQGIMFGEGFGKICNNVTAFEADYEYCLTNFKRNGIDYFGTYCPSVPTPSTGIIANQIDLSTSFIYPNPASSFIQLSVAEKSSLEMSNSLGQVVFLGELEAGSKIDISQFPEGIYFLRLKNSSGSFPQKLLIQR